MRIEVPDVKIENIDSKIKDSFQIPDFATASQLDSFINLASALKDEVPQYLGERDTYQNVGIVGIGGSQVQPYVLDPVAEKTVFHLEVPDPYGALKEIHDLPEETTRILYISRSGTTKEVLSFVPYLQHFKSLAVTNGGYLLKIAKASSIPIIKVSYDISGRFAIANELGIVPMIAIGLDPVTFLASLKKSYEDFFQIGSKADEVAKAIYSLEKKALAKMRILPSGEFTKGLGILLTQLINESTPKKSNDILDASLHLMPRSAHSDVQRWYGGLHDSFIFSIRAQNYTQDIAGPPIESKIKSYIPGSHVTSSKHLNITSKAVEDTFPDHVFKVILEKDKLAELSYTVGFFHALTVRLCQLKGSNPFNQPAVQNYKERATKIYNNL